MIWASADSRKPPSYRCVLVQIPASPRGDAAGVAVGYWKDKGSDGAYWVVPGARGGFEVSHWCDCLGDDFEAPLWPGTAAGGALNNRWNLEQRQSAEATK